MSVTSLNPLLNGRGVIQLWLHLDGVKKVRVFFFLNEVCDEEERLNLAPHHRDTGKDSDLQAMEGTIQ